MKFSRQSKASVVRRKMLREAFKRGYRKALNEQLNKEGWQVLKTKLKSALDFAYTEYSDEVGENWLPEKLDDMVGFVANVFYDKDVGDYAEFYDLPSQEVQRAADEAVHEFLREVDEDNGMALTKMCTDIKEYDQMEDDCVFQIFLVLRPHNNKYL